MAKIKRKVLKINNANLLRHLKIISQHGILEQGNQKAVQVGRDLFYWQKGTEKFNLTDQEVGKLLI